MRNHAVASLPVLAFLVHACSGTPDDAFTSGGQASSSGTGTSASGGGGGGGSAGCTGTEQKCEGGAHFVCQDGVFVEQSCPPDQGCAEATGGCAPCVCMPGDPATCVGAGSIQHCSATCTELVTEPCGGGTTCYMGACVSQLCTPGTPSCIDDQTYEICNDDGSGWVPGGTCGPKETCDANNGCVSLCDFLAGSPSSVGCSFFALNMDNFNEGNPDAVVVGNTSETLTASVSLYGSPGGVEQVIEANIQIPPLGLHTFMLPNGANDVIEVDSALRIGGAFRVESDLPVIAYQHSPLQPQATNDASCLLPEPTLGQHYVVGSYLDALGSYPSYVNVIGTQPNTTVTVTAKNATIGGFGVQALAAGQSQTITLNRYDTLQISAAGGANADITGIDIKSTAPVAVFGAVECAQVPAGYTFCDHLEEQSVPVRNWGKIYVGAHTPKRSATERYYWRVLAYKDGTVIDTDPPQTGFPQTLSAGQHYEFWTQESFIFTGSEPFGAFQYVTGQDAFGANTGDPAMMTAVPVEQFLTRYVVLTPSGYSQDYLQIIRPAGGADVIVDGSPVPAAEFYTVGQFEVADHPVAAGPHSLTSAQPFGIMGVGYTGVTSYAYPGGLALNNLNP